MCESQLSLVHMSVHAFVFKSVPEAAAYGVGGYRALPDSESRQNLVAVRSRSFTVMHVKRYIILTERFFLNILIYPLDS